MRLCSVIAGTSRVTSGAGGRGDTRREADGRRPPRRRRPRSRSRPGGGSSDLGVGQVDVAPPAVVLDERVDVVGVARLVFGAAGDDIGAPLHGKRSVVTVVDVRLQGGGELPLEPVHRSPKKL